MDAGDFVIESLPLSAVIRALILVGVVLLEAVALYLGYGYLEQVAAPAILDKIEKI